MNDMVNKWHGAIIKFHDSRPSGEEWPRWMYQAKTARSEVARLPLLFAQERTCQLRQSHQRCSQTAPVLVSDNHLTCCLGVECRKCPELLALESATMTPEQVDEAKAWTCVTHIISKGGDPQNKGYILTTDDQMFWGNVHASLASGAEEP